ncbi:hypothetical protein WMY93_029870 [Mugilogobius chulae]|uniref:Uncharacterized protein n=1 Tax=Mugilogobius chulae TaxID=88201 RepID=A0AAW0MQJ3_9GOBI
MSAIIPRLQLKRYLALILSPEVVTSTLARELKLGTLARKLWLQITGENIIGPIEGMDMELDIRMARHNTICTILIREASALGWTHLSEPKLTTTDGKVGRPDIVLWKNGEAHVIDESGEDSLLDMEFFKRGKYFPFMEQVRLLHSSIQTVRVWGFPLGARGSGTAQISPSSVLWECPNPD